MASKPTYIRWIITGFKPKYKKLCIVQYNRQFSTKDKIKIIILTPILNFLSQGFRPLGANKTGINPIIYSLTIRGNLTIIRCDKSLLSTRERERTMGYLLHQSPKFNNNVLLFVGLTTLGTLVNFNWLVYQVECSNVSTCTLIYRPLSYPFRSN